MLKGLLTDSNTNEDSPDHGISEQEAVALFNRLEVLVNTTITNQETLITLGSNNKQTLTTLQEQVSAMFSTLNSVKNDVKTILRLTQASTNSSEDEYTATSLPHSCEEIKSSSPNSPSDYYTIVDNDGRTRHVYCHMGRLCESDEGWTRIAYLNMSDPKEKCMDGFKLYEVNGKRACGKYSSGCLSTLR